MLVRIGEVEEVIEVVPVEVPATLPDKEPAPKEPVPA